MELWYENIRFLKDCFLFFVWRRLITNKSLKKYKGIHKGKRCFIIGTGPSLKLEDIECLKNEYTFAVNSCFKVFDKTNWRPTYYVITDPKFVIEMEKDLIRYNNEIKCGFCGNETNWDLRNVNIINCSHIYINLPQKGIVRRIADLSGFNFMSDDISHGMISGHTVVFSALQIAEYMGFDRVYLLGIDCNYTGKLQYSKLTAHTHINNPNAADIMIMDYLYAKRHFDKRMATIYNATRGGKLEIFERVNLNELLGKN